MNARRPYDLESLTDVALRVFAERGFDGASMDDVARAAGITKAAIYHHFSGKEALLEYGLSRALGRLFAVLEEPGAREGRSIERFRYIVGRVAGLAVAMLPELTVLVRVRGNSAVERRALARRRAFDAAVAQIVRKAQREGDVEASIDAGLLVRVVFGTCNSLVEWYRPGGAVSPKRLAQIVDAVVFRGILQPTNR
jgi:AcrR family transcriptional regulator